MVDRKLRVLLLFGGRSSEHSVSCVTAAGVMHAIDRERFDVIPVGITRDGGWTLLDKDPEGWALDSGQLPEISSVDHPVQLSPETNTTSLQSLTGAIIAEVAEVDVVIPLLHVRCGGDGSIQGMLETAGVPYDGSGIAASAM